MNTAVVLIVILVYNCKHLNAISLGPTAVPNLKCSMRYDSVMNLSIKLHKTHVTTHM